MRRARSACSDDTSAAGLRNCRSKARAHNRETVARSRHGLVVCVSAWLRRRSEGALTRTLCVHTHTVYPAAVSGAVPEQRRECELTPLGECELTSATETDT